MALRETPYLRQMLLTFVGKPWSFAMVVRTSGSQLQTERADYRMHNCPCGCSLEGFTFWLRWSLQGCTALSN